MFRRLRMRWELRRGRALDIWSTGEYPADVLSNLCSNRFRLDGIECQGMEGFLQSLKYEDTGRQRQICSMKGRNAKRQSTTTWQTDQIVWWRGVAIDRQSQAYQDLLRRAYQAMFDQNDRFRAALMASRGRRLYHSQGNTDPFKTILTQEEFCSILMEIRDAYDARDKQLPPPPRTVCIPLAEFLESGDDVLEVLRVVSRNYDSHICVLLPNEKEDEWTDLMMNNVEN